MKNRNNKRRGELDSDDPRILKWENEWRDSQRRYGDEELAGLFPEARWVVYRQLQKTKKEYAILRKNIKKRLFRIRRMNTDEPTKDFLRAIVRHFLIADLNKMGEKIGRLKWLFSCYSLKRNAGRKKWELAKEKARNIPITKVVEYYIGRLRRSGSTFTARCPFHEDRHPSFVVYPKTNSYHCFGCQAHGNVIKFVRNTERCSFGKAVRILNRSNNNGRRQT